MIKHAFANFRVNIRCISSREAFTLLEIVLFCAVFTLAVIGISTIFVTFTNLHARQSSTAEVNQQSQFLLQQIQLAVENSSMVDIPPDTATSTLYLRMSSSSQDVARVYLSTSTPARVYLQMGPTSTSPQSLTSARVNVSNLLFTKRSQAPGKDSVTFSFTLAYHTSNPRQAFSQSLQSTIARVNAATFDSGIFPATSSFSYNLGDATRQWSTINSIINFNGNNVGIQNVNPGYALDVTGQVNASGGLCIDGTCKNDWSQVAGGGSIDIRFSRNVSSNASNAAKDNSCSGSSGPGPSYVAATFLDAVAIPRVTGISNGAFVMYGTSSAYFLQSGGLAAAGGNVGNVMCIFDSAPIRFSRTAVNHNASDATKDAQCQTDFSSYYVAGTLLDAAAIGNVNGSQVENDAFVVVGDSSQAYYLRSGSIAGAGPMSGPVMCVHN